MNLASDARGPQAAAESARSRPSPRPASTLPSAAFQTPRMVRFSDCDPAGIAYTPRYVDMLNGVIEDFFPAALALDYHSLIADGLGLGYASLNCDFFRPGHMGDRLIMTALVDRIGRTSADFVIHGHQGDDEILRGRLVMVTTWLGQAIPLPPPIRAALTRYQEHCQ